MSNLSVTTSRSYKDTSPGVQFMSTGLLQLSAVRSYQQTHAASTVGAFFFFLSSLRGRQLLSCLALRPQIGPNALPLTNQKPNDKGEGLYPQACR